MQNEPGDTSPTDTEIESRILAAFRPPVRSVTVSTLVVLNFQRPDGDPEFTARVVACLTRLQDCGLLFSRFQGYEWQRTKLGYEMPAGYIPPTDAELDTQLLGALRANGRTNISALCLQHIAGPVPYSRFWRRRIVDRLHGMRERGAVEYVAGGWRLPVGADDA